MASSTTPPRKTPITILTGFAGSGKTTLLLNTLPQLRARHSSAYRLALIKNEIGDLAVDTALGAAAELAGSQELLGDCICCTNVGQIEDALAKLREECAPDRVVIETSGSAEPVKLVLEVNRVARATGLWELDGVVSVVDAENWGGYASTSFTARVQAQQTDLIVVNKWEGLDERAYEAFLDRLGDLDVETPQVKSDRGVVGVDVLFGVDERSVAGDRRWLEDAANDGHGHGHVHEHKDEVECVSVTLTSATVQESNSRSAVDLAALEKMLKAAPKDEVFRIKAILHTTASPTNSDGIRPAAGDDASNGQPRRWILNWSFGRWTWTAVQGGESTEPALRMSIFTAQYESNKWTKKVQNGEFLRLEGGAEGELVVKRVQ